MAASKLKVVYMGTPLFAVPGLEALAADPGIEVTAVITREDQKVGRKQILTPPPVKIATLALDIPVLQPPQLKGNADIAKLIRDMHPDFIVVAAYGHILPAEILKIPKYGCVNLHGSLLPKYRGASPIEEALLNGDTDTGITFIKMNEKMDAGDILYIQRIPIDPKDDALTLRAKISLIGATQLPFVLKDLREGTIEPIPQNESKATHCRKISKEDGAINLARMTAHEICNRIRAYTPWPQCFLMVDGKRFKITAAAFDENAPGVKPAQIIENENGTVAIGTAKGLLLPKTVQLEGKKEMSIQEFTRGNKDFFKKLAVSAK